ncbi:hypothetical protein MTO96_001357 [Rhipicephalus appendiculatus]
MRAHITDSSLKKIKAANCTPVVIPGGMTKMVQPLDIAINRSFKFNVGDRVLCAIGARRWTLDPRFEGLYAIVGFRGKDIALIRRAATSGSDADTAVNIEQLCLYHERGDDADELADTSIGLQSGRGA